jgi:cytochrome c biogenesis protein CcdA
MLRLLLPLVSSLQIGARIKDTIERSVKKAIIIAIAAIVFLFAIAFGLLAAYHAIIINGFSPLESAGLVAGGLVVVALIVLAFLPLVDRQQKTQTQTLVNAPAEGVAMIEQGVGKAMKQVGPVTLLVAAFAAGLLASRRR